MLPDLALADAGAFVLQAAGVADGRRLATHRAADRLAALGVDADV